MTEKTKLAEVLEALQQIRQDVEEVFPSKDHTGRFTLIEDFITPCEGEGKAKCETCEGTGKCTNPDHGFIEAVGHDIGRIGCPSCGHSGKCPDCDGEPYTPPPVLRDIVERLEGEKKESFPQSYYPNEKSFTAVEEQKKIHNAALDLAKAIVKEVGV